MGGEKLAAIFFRQRVPVVDRKSMAEAGRVVGLHRFEETKGERIRELAVLLESLAIISALDVVEAACVAAVVAGEDATDAVNLDAPGIAAAFAVNLKLFFLGMISPDVLADHLGEGSLVARPFDLGG